MKIGVDAVILGAWADVGHAESILDVGTGCGVIALMCAQRNPDASIVGIDIDAPSVEEASENFCESKWASRLRATKENFVGIVNKKFDVIISNPPFFNSGIDKPDTSRLKARHENELSPASLITYGKHFLTGSGHISMILPHDRIRHILEVVHEEGMFPIRACKVRGNVSAHVKRVLLEVGFNENPEFLFEELTLEISAGQPTAEYRRLCKDFYLYF